MVQYYGHAYTKKLLLAYLNSNITGCPVFFFFSYLAAPASPSLCGLHGCCRCAQQGLWASHCPDLLIRKFPNMAGLPVTNNLTLPMTHLNQNPLRKACLHKRKRSHFKSKFFFFVCLKQWRLSPELLHLTRLPSGGRSCELRLKLTPLETFFDASIVSKH